MPDQSLFESVPFRAALDALHDLVTIETAIRDDDGVVVDFCIDYMNTVDIDVAGRDRAALIGRRVLDVYPAMADSDLFRTYVEVVDQHRTVVIDELPYEDTIDGSEVVGYYSVIVAPFGTDGIIISARDISDTLRAQAALRDAYERLDAAQRLAGIGLWEADLATGTLVISDELRRVFGLAPDEQIPSFATALGALVEEAARPQLEGETRRALEHARPFTLELDIRRRDGAVRTLVLFGIPNQENPPSSLWGTAQDITDQRSAQDALRAAREELEREHAVATLLLESMRPALSPQPHVDVAARYVPAGQAAAVGGDWFDAIELDDHTMLVVVGDIAGHGIAAAALMAQIRNGIRACGFAGLDPSEILHTVGHMLRSTEPESMATCIVGIVSLDDGRFSWASAGHPPPLSLDRHHGARFLTGAPGPPLPFPDAHYEVHDETLAGSTAALVLYTDGLIERRDRSLDAGLEELRRAANESIGMSSDELADVLLQTLTRDDRHTDDICILVLSSPHVAAQ